MIRMKQWMKPLSRVMVMNLAWMAWIMTSAEAQPVQTTSRVIPGSHSKTDRFQETRHDAVPVDFQDRQAGSGSVHKTVLESTRNTPQGEDRKFPEKNTVLANAGNFGGFIITYSAVLAGYLVLYVPLGSYGAAKCVFDKEGWNECWNGYMNKTFH